MDFPSRVSPIDVLDDVDELRERRKIAIHDVRSVFSYQARAGDQGVSLRSIGIEARRIRKIHIHALPLEEEVEIAMPKVASRRFDLWILAIGKEHIAEELRIHIPYQEHDAQTTSRERLAKA